jgi:Protease inhibitor Inh
MVTYDLRPLGAPALILLAGVLLAGCSSNPLGSSNFLSSLSPQHAAASAPAAAAPPPPNMAGRWQLAAANGQQCYVNFSGAQGAAQGAVAPEGGCPGNFFTTRHWAFQHGSLALLDHKSKLLVQMKRNAEGRFEGETANKELVWLER